LSRVTEFHRQPLVTEVHTGNPHRNELPNRRTNAVRASAR
jgi:hypothetical protein